MYGGKSMAIENDDKNSIHWEISEEDFRNAKIDCFVLEGEEKMLVGLRYGKDKSNTRVLALAKGNFKNVGIREVTKAFQKMIINPTLDQINEKSASKEKSVNIDNISLEEIAQMCDGDLEVTKQCQILLDKLRSGDFDVFKNGEKLELPKTDVYKDHHVYHVMSEQAAKRVVSMETKKGFTEYWKYLRELKKSDPEQYDKINHGRNLLDAITKFETLGMEIKANDITDVEKAKAVEMYLNQVPNFDVSSILEYMATSKNEKYQGLANYLEKVKEGDKDYVLKIRSLFNTGKLMSNEYQNENEEDINLYCDLMNKFDIGFRLDAFKEQWQEDVENIKLGKELPTVKGDADGGFVVLEKEEPGREDEGK